MKLLGLDTATITAGVAIAELTRSLDAGGADRLEELATRRARVTTHSEMLVAMLADALDEARVPVAALDAVICGAGPGSFTGLRIGIATAKGLAFALGKPLYVVSSLEALALRAPSGSLVSAGIDAYKGEIYAGLYRRGAGPRIERVGAEIVVSPAAWAERLSAVTPLWLVGDAYARYPELLVPGSTRLDDDPAPHPLDVVRLGAAQIAAGRPDAIVSGEPTYIRPSEAELKLAPR